MPEINNQPTNIGIAPPNNNTAGNINTAPNTPATSSSLLGRKKLLILFTSVLLITFIALISFVVFKFTQDSFIALPVKRTDPSIQSLAISYNFFGKITNIRKTSKGQVLTLDGQNVPEITDLKDETLVYRFINGNLVRGSNGKLTRFDSSDLKVGQNVRVTMLYLTGAKRWTPAWQITIYP